MCGESIAKSHSSNQGGEEYGAEMLRTGEESESGQMRLRTSVSAICAAGKNKCTPNKYCYFDNVKKIKSKQYYRLYVYTQTPLKRRIKDVKVIHFHRFTASLI